MHPCQCGYLGHPLRGCTCASGAAEHYRKRISGPLLDRLDLLVETPPLSLAMLAPGREEESSADVRRRVEEAWAFRRLRAGSGSTGPSEGSAHPHRLEAEFELSEQAQALLRDVLAREPLGGRGYVRAMKVARTVADLDGSAGIRLDHMAEALALRLAYPLRGAA